MIDMKPTVNPLEIPMTKPSEIVRNWPDAMWTTSAQRVRSYDGHVRFCARGILHETAGGEWGKSCICQAPPKTIIEAYGLTMGQVLDLQLVNDRHGKAAAADYLESLGL